MKATYDVETDTLTIIFKPDDVAESDEDKPGVILDYNAIGELVGMEILDASRHIPNVTHFDFSVARPHV
jgi:uncharacterized protein YuzE